jgi:peptidyl-prolyl cis-trans isomerase SurA
MKFYAVTLIFLSFNLAFSKEVINKIIASVSSEVVLLSDLNSFEKRISRAGSVDDALLLGQKIDTLKGNKKAQLDYLVREKIIEAEVKRLGLSVPDSQVEGEMSQMAKRNRMDAEAFGRYLQTEGYSLHEYKKVLKSRIERQNLFEREIISKLRITDEDAYGVFQTSYPNYRPSVGQFKISQIFFSNKKGGANEARARADAAEAKLKSGNKFETLANQLDETPGANADGYLGEFKSGEFLPDIENAIARMRAGEISTVLKGPNGFHIVKLIEKKTVLDPNFAKVKENIRAALVQQNFERQLKNWFEFRKTDSNIKIYENATQ